jgi:putative FmdB family regulatory protein
LRKPDFGVLTNCGYERSFPLPLYEYKCVKCGHRFEKIEVVTASETKKCSKCGARAQRMASAPAIQFKGSGWYVTDYAGKGSAATPSEGSGEASPAKDSEKSSDKSAESKTQSKADPKSESRSESKPAASDNSNKGAANRKKK